MSVARSRAIAGRLGEADGFTMIELVVSIFIVIIVMGALSALFVTSNDSSFASQREFSQLSVLQQQIEHTRQVVKEYGFSALALTSTPNQPTDSPLPANPTNPDDFVSGTGCSEAFTVESNYNITSESYPAASGTIADNPEPLLVNGCTVSGSAISGGQLAPVQYVDLTTDATSSTAPSSDPYATVYTFVTQTTTVGCNTSLGSCTGDARRVILAVLLNHTATDIGASYPTYSTTVITNPVASDQTNNASGLRVLGLIP